MTSKQCGQQIFFADVTVLGHCWRHVGQVVYLQRGIPEFDSQTRDDKAAQKAICLKQ